MELNAKDIKLLFLCDTSEAIEECQRIICSVSNFNSFHEFYNYHLTNSHVSTCQNEWSTNKQMSIHCDDCSNSPNACVCLQCFLNGNHQGHQYVVNPNSTGNCDCGDMSSWKRSGFCSHHHGLENDSHPEDYIDEKLRTALTDVIFKGAFSAIKHLTDDDGNNLSIIYQFLISFLKFGDGFRRLIVISLTEKINFEKLFDSIFDATYEFNIQLLKFCGFLTNDQVFKYKFAPINYKLMINKIIPLQYKQMETGVKNRNISPWNHFWFHSYQTDSVKNSINENKLNYNEFFINIVNSMKDLFLFFGLPNRNVPHYFFEFATYTRSSSLLTDEQIQNLFDNLFTQILSSGTTNGKKNGENDTIISTSFSQDLPIGFFQYLFQFKLVFSKSFNAFKSKKNLKFDKMFDELNKTIDINQIFSIENDNENDKFVTRFIVNNQNNSNKKCNESFQKGGCFFISNPMFYSLAYLIRNDNLSRVKIARFLSNEKYSILRIKLGIIALKSAMANICANQKIVKRENLGALSYFSITNDNCSSFGISLLFPLMQLLIGLQTNGFGFGLKEFFAFESAKEIGFFDNDNEKALNEMKFTFLYFAILLVVERTLFNFDGYKYIKEQLIFEFKKGKSNLSELKKSYDFYVYSSLSKSSIFNKIISEISTSRQKVKKGKNENGFGSGDQDVTLELKEGIEFNFISAINLFNQEKAIMNEMITKNPESLIKIPQFEPEETYFFHKKNENEEEIDSSGLSIQLKDFLMTPTVFAIVYKTLRRNDDDVNEKQKIEINDHLAMNILVLISKFVSNSDENSNSIEFDSIIQYNSNLVDLISQLKRIVFKFNIDENGNATLTNTMNKKSFNSFMNVKIGSNSESPKSFVDLLLEKGPIGKSVLNQMSIEIDNKDDEKDKQDIIKMKKIRAQKLKEQIINHYKTVTLNFNKGDDDDDDNDDEQAATGNNTNNEKDVCSICSNSKKNGILSFPLYIYRTKFPFIIDKPPLVSMPIRTAIKETEVYQDEELLSNNNDNENDDDDFIIDDENIPDPEDVFARILGQIPNLDIVDGISEHEIQMRRAAIDDLHQRIIQQYNIAKQQIEEQRKQKEQERISRIQREKEAILKREKELKDPNLIVQKQVTPGNNFVIQFGMCQHLVHPNCIKDEDFNCPIDRSYKNGFLPNIDDLSKDLIFVNKMNKEINEENLSTEIKDSLNNFINKYSLFFESSLYDNKIVDLFVELIKSISGLIATYEIRLRSLPDCLDSKKTKLLSRNLFLSTWYAYRMKGKPKMKTGFKSDESEDVDSKLTTFQKFIKKLIECDEIEENKKFSLHQIISSFNSSLFKCEKEFCLFLRRVCLADHFLLNNNNNNDDDDESKLIDWDEILALQNLSQKFDVKFNSDKEFEFKPFIFSKMPKEFLRFAQEPYNFPVDQTQKDFTFNVLNYNFLIQNYNEFETENDESKTIEYSNELTSYHDKNTKVFLYKNISVLNYPTVFLFIGSQASNVCVIYGKRIKYLRPFYMDEYGCADIGFKRRLPLFLNEERYDRVMDQILSGDFSNGLDKF